MPRKILAARRQKREIVQGFSLTVRMQEYQKLGGGEQPPQPELFQQELPKPPQKSSSEGDAQLGTCGSGHEQVTKLTEEQAPRPQSQPPPIWHCTLPASPVVDEKR